MKKEQIICRKADDYKPILITQEIIDELQVGDWVFSQYSEPYYGSDSGEDGHFYFDIHRLIEETEEEVKKREEKVKQKNAQFKKNRHETYLKLKKEFENDSV